MRVSLLTSDVMFLIKFLPAEISIMKVSQGIIVTFTLLNNFNLEKCSSCLTSVVISPVDKGTRLHDVNCNRMIRINDIIVICFIIS